jgi:PKD repeat protein
VTIALRKGSPLRVRAEASTLKTRPGEPVEFRAEAEGAGAGETFAYSWHFDDGSSAEGPNATHSFARRGSYDVVVGVTTPGDSTGTSAVVTIQVGQPLAGPDRKGGGTSRDDEAPDHGAATGSGGEGVPAAPTPATSPAPGTAEQKPRSEPKPQAAPQDELVTGQLLSATASPQPKPKASPAARRGSLDGEKSGGPSLPNAALGLLVTAGLLGAGALTEARSLLR